MRRTPVQIIAGRHDALVPPNNAQFLHTRLAHSKLDILETGQFAWEDGTDDYLELARSWIEVHHTPGPADELPKRHRWSAQHVERLGDT